MTSDVQHRAATPQDMPHVYDSWLRSYRDSVPRARGMRRESPGGPKFDVTGPPADSREYWAGHSRAIAAAIDRGADVIVAYSSHHPRVICGWTCIERSALHYVYVGHAFRRMGVARGLLLSSAGLTSATHWTPVSRTCPLLKDLRWNPYLFFGGSE